MTRHESEAGVEPTPNTGRRESKIGHMMDSIRNSISHEQERLFHPHRHAAEHPAATTESKEPETNGSSISPAVQAEQTSHLNENNMGPHSHERTQSWGWPGLGTFTNEESQNAAESRRKSSVKPGADPNERRKSWGFPGLGTFDEPPEDAAEAHAHNCGLEHHRRQSEIEQRRQSEIEKRRQSSVKPAGVPTVPEQESWGWPGLGVAPTEEGRRKSSAVEAARRKSSAPKGPLEPRLEAAAEEAIDQAAEESSYGWPGLGQMPQNSK